METKLRGDGIVARASKLVIAAVVLLAAGCMPGSDVGSNAQVFVVDVASGDHRQVTDGSVSYSSPAWSRDGRLASVLAGPEASGIEIVGADGRKSTVAPGFVQGLAWSPDGTTLAYVRYREPHEWTLETVRPDGSHRRRLATHRASVVSDSGASWSPDGTRIAYAAGRDTFVIPARGGSPTPLASHAWAPRWSPDGRFVLVVQRAGPRTQSSIRVLAAPVGGGRPLVVASGLLAAHAAWSPDGERVAFSAATFSGDRRYHLHVSSAGTRRVRQFSDEIASTAPAWSPDGRTLAVASWDGEILLVDPEDGHTTTLARLRNAHIRDLTWSPDGRSLAFVAQQAPETGFGY